MTIAGIYLFVKKTRFFLELWLFFLIFAAVSLNITFNCIMRKGLWLTALTVFVCGFVMSALMSCGNDSEDSSVEYEVSVVGVLPKAVAPYLVLEVTYNDEQGNTKTFTVDGSNASETLPQYISQTVSLLSLGRVNSDNCVFRQVSFRAPEGRKVGCRYKVVRNQQEVTAAPTDAYSAPFAFVIARQVGTDALVMPQSFSISTVTSSMVEAFSRYLQLWDGKEGECTIQI